MVECGQCGEQLDDLAYSCNYCGQSNCSDHRLPEKHDCIALQLTRPPESSKAEADAHLGNPRNFRGDEDFIEWVKAFRDRHSPSSSTDDADDEAFREALNQANASEQKVEEVVENVKSELEDPDEKPYSVFEPEYTVGTQPDPNFSPSPDVAPDGSVAGTETDVEAEPESPRGRTGVLGVPIEIVTVCVALGLLVAMFLLL